MFSLCPYVQSHARFDLFSPRYIAGYANKFQLIVLIFAILCFLTLGSVAAEATKDGLIAQVSRSGAAGLCYRRVYDRLHLRQNVKQMIVAITVQLKPEPSTPHGADQPIGLVAAIDLRDDPDRRYAMASCWWEAEANLLGGRRHALPMLASDDGIRCMSAVAPNSAEEAGELVLGSKEAGETLFVFNGLFQMRSGQVGARVMRDVAFGKEDQILKLKRVDPNECSGIENALSEPVKHQHR
ncbi:hypothetical protein [Methylobacterium oryzisoli]|uniref:hypothetical protein n=1 Tax=Methylobacterium oryzisoli TaxID=3385502 RepID=UPI003891E90F